MAATARLLVVDPDERVLLFSSADDGGDGDDNDGGDGGSGGDGGGRTYWFTPGGGLQADETVTEAAVRELAEETGFACTEAELGPVVATSASRFTGYDGRLYFGAHAFFFLRVRQPEIVIDGREEYELSFITGHRWWTIDELRSATDAIFPPPQAFANLMGRLLRGDVPARPVRLPGR